jgi:hypothetical protein
MKEAFVSTHSRTSFPPAPGELSARLLAGLVLAGTIATLALISVNDPWWLVWRAWGLILVGAAAGAATVWALRVPPRQVIREVRPSADIRGPSRPPAPVDDRAWGGGGSARRPGATFLAGEVVGLLDAAPSDSMRYRIRRMLSDAGVVEYAADGEVFDPERHNVVDVEWTDDPARESRVARTLRPGFADGPRILRVADVLVYRGSQDARTEQSRRTVP